MSSNIFSETESTTSSNESRASSTSPKTPQKVYRMASNFELGDEQPDNPTPRRKPFKPSGNSYLFNSFSLFGCETNRSNCEWLVFPKSRGIRENGLENPYFGISRRRRRREIVKGFERPFSLIPSDLGETSFTVRKVCRTPKKGQMNWTDNFFKFYQYFCVIMNTLISLKVNC